MTGSDRAKLLAKLHEQLRSVRFEIKSNQSQAVRKVRQIKRSIARILTAESGLSKEVSASTQTAKMTAARSSKTMKKASKIVVNTPDNAAEKLRKVSK